MPNTIGFHHVTMVAQNAPRTVRFYRDVLGLKLVKRTVNFDDPGAYHLYFGDATGAPGTILTFFEWPDSRRGRWGVGGVHHVALGVADQEAQLKWKRWLTENGVTVTGPYDRGWFHSIYFEDPDGQILEIATRGPGYDLDEPIESLGQRVIMPDEHRMRGARDEEMIARATYPEPVTALTSDMTLQGIHHVTGITDDIDRAHEFYEQALGLKLVKRTVNQDDPGTPHLFWAAYDGTKVEPHSSMTLFAWPNSDYYTRPGAGQTHHIAFRAPDEDRLREWMEQLHSMGIETSPVMDRSYFRSVYFRAPDGLLHELATDAPGFAIDEPVERLGEELRLPSWLESRKDSIARSLAPLP